MTLTSKQQLALDLVAEREKFAAGPMAADVAAALYLSRVGRTWSEVGLASSLLGSLARRGLVRFYYDGDKRWRLTEAGQKVASSC